jgi:hypothetical protein
MEPYGLGVVELMDNLETQQQPIDPLQSPHLLEGPTGNKFLVVFNIQQQSRLMELYGLGVAISMDNLETQQQPMYLLQSPHLLEEPIGNK